MRLGPKLKLRLEPKLKLRLEPNGIRNLFRQEYVNSKDAMKTPAGYLHLFPNIFVRCYHNLNSRFFADIHYLTTIGHINCADDKKTSIKIITRRTESLWRRTAQHKKRPFAWSTARYEIDNAPGLAFDPGKGRMIVF